MGWTASAADTYAAMKLLDNAGVKYTKLSYTEEEQYKANFDALSTWSFGAEENAYQKQFTDFPILVWEECYDDWNKWIHSAHGLEEIKASKVLVPGVKII